MLIMARTGTEIRKRNATVTARVEPEIKFAVAKAAGTRTESDWLRSIIIERLDLNIVEVDRPKKRARTKLSASKNAELGQLARAVAQATGMLKISAQAFREAGKVNLHSDTEVALAEINKAASRIFELLDVKSK
ncbi:hypothetical protein WNY59_15945 [Ahrensia kielensis]|uniref:Relaxosome protein TraY n=1 Tax=Ahrensia kielensis TaxID=76980 RepID=A0ABU9TAC0_9HYPH